MVREVKAGKPQVRFKRLASSARTEELPADFFPHLQHNAVDLANYPPELIRNFCIVAHIDHGKSASELVLAAHNRDATQLARTDRAPSSPTAGTLADRMLELTGTIPPTQASSDRQEEDMKNEQVLDTLKVERERGITVRAQSSSMFYDHPGDGKRYLLNLLDTPGHVDFTSELLRSLLPSQGALLLVDAAQVDLSSQSRTQGSR